MFAAAALGALAQPAFAQSVWERLERGADVVSECAGDVVRHCKGIVPGGGRIKACMLGHLQDMSTACLTALAGPRPTVFSDGDKAVSKRIDMRNVRYIEIFLADIDPVKKGLVAACYGSYGIPVIPADRDTAPQALVAALNMDEIAKKYGVLGASLNGPKLSIADWWEIGIGETRQFGGMELPHTAQLNLSGTANVNDVKPYEPTTIARKSAVNWNKGRTVMVLDAPDGSVWIMKGFQLGLDPKISYEAFMAAGPDNFKKLPPGWKARVATLEQDNLEIPENGIAHIVSDEFFNVYDKTGPGMSNYKP
ncbi:MAG: hypothetical protein IOC90_01220 [Methylocystis sp.]|nr:hypothetical protein [Methylocystis sp.]MCA3584001.1 hypothetical protein [Methylocystis sp.]MCA3586645.1 hypothetical protein [Methylocystis sp.]MCA3591535.1 hypothetical protein [Methylocystis sp.]